MAWTTIVLVSTGELATAAVQNTQVLGNLNELRTGGIAIASQAAGDVIIGSSDTQLGRVASAADATKFLNGAATPAYALVKDSDLSTSDVTTNNVTTAKHGFTPKAPNDTAQFLRGDAAWATVSAQVDLLKALSGTDTNAAATNVDTVAISGLTAKDRIVILFTIDSVTQQTASPSFYNDTDGVSIGFPNANAAVAAGETTPGLTIVQQAQQSSTVVTAYTGAAYVTTGASRHDARSTAVTTAWTGAWTLALRHAGVTGGGTFRWSWIVLKVKGQ